VEYCRQTGWLSILRVLQRSRKLVCCSYNREIMRCALPGYYACARCVTQRLRPGRDVGVVSVRINVELLSEVRKERRKAVLAFTC
jgi:hypothetical protein